MSKKKKSLSSHEAHKDYTEAHYVQAMDRVLESIDQLRKKEGPIFERWKAGMKAYLDSLESKEG